MLQQNTGEALCDSGGVYGRHWERNAKRTQKDFENEPVVSGNKEDGETISVYHYLTEEAGLSLDDLCDEYNNLKCDAFDSDIYGVSKKQKKWLDKKGFKVVNDFNSYNDECYLSQVIQGTYITDRDNDDANYVLLQIHQGCDVRGGYTDAKLFKLGNGLGGLIPEIYLLPDNQE